MSGIFVSLNLNGSFSMLASIIGTFASKSLLIRMLPSGVVTRKLANPLLPTSYTLPAMRKGGNGSVQSGLFCAKALPANLHRLFLGHDLPPDPYTNRWTTGAERLRSDS